MSLLREIQSSLMQQGQEIGPILLKLRFLASRLGSAPLEDWVRHESEGYPEEVDVPGYRLLSVSYTATFSGPLGSGINNAPIPPYLIEKFAGSKWTVFEMRQSVAAIDELVRDNSSTVVHTNAANLILLLQGKVYEGYACNSVTGSMSKASLAEIQHAVRARILELTIELEKAIPAAADIELGPSKDASMKDADSVTKITHQIIHGNLTNISNSGEGAVFHFNNVERDPSAFLKALVDSGITQSDAEEFVRLVAEEEGGTSAEPFGKKAKEWIVKNIKKAADGTWKVGVAAATNILTEATLKYYGLK